MSDQRSGSASSPFEAIRHTTGDGAEYWSARELSKTLDYAQWRNFTGVIEAAKTACELSGQTVSDHFADTSTMIATGKGAQREVEDVHLSRYACYLIVQNADPEKPIVALGQTYFAVQTRRQELADRLAELSDAQRRIAIRDEVVARNTDLSAAAAAQAGLVTGKDFSTFHDHGYKGLYGGETAKDIAVRKGLTKRQRILDWMESEELAANWFRITQTEAKLRRGEATTPEEANRAHHDMGKAVRGFILDQGGTPPEQLPTPTESIQQLRRIEQQHVATERQPSLFVANRDETDQSGDK